MIVNSYSMERLQVEWQGVIRMRERMRQLVFTTFAIDARRSPAFGDIFYNLPLLLAGNVLKQVLLRASANESCADCGDTLVELLDQAKTSLPWLDWESLQASVKHRNEVAHHGKLYGDVQCLQDIAAIEAQLVAWHILPAA